MALGEDGDFCGAKLGALADEVFPDRGVAVAGLVGDAACGRKLGALERPAGAGLGEAPLAGLGADVDDGALVDVELGELGAGDGVSPGVLVRAVPPLAAARAAAASAGLEAPRTGAVVLVDGGGVAIVGPDEKAEPGRTLLEVEDAGRAGLDDDGFDGLDGAAGERPPLDPEPDDDPDDDPEPDDVPEPAGAPDVEGVDAGDDARPGAEAAGAEAEEARAAVGEAGAEDADAAVAAAGADVEDVGAAEDGAGRPPEAPALDGVADREGTDDGRGGDEGAERDGVGVERAVAGADDAAEGEPARPEPAGAAGAAGAEPAGAEAAGVAFVVTVGDVGLTGGLSGRAPAGRTRVVSSVPPSLGALDVAFVDASVLIGTVPPPGICRDVLSDRWLLSELTCHLHAQAADEEPGDSTRDPARHRPTRTQDPPVRPILALRAWLDDSSPLMHLDRKCPR